MITKPKFIKTVEKKTDQFFSQLNISETCSYEKVLEKKFPKFFSSAEYSNSKLEYSEFLLKTNQGFYIYVIRNRLNKSECSLYIYYLEEQHNELLFFIKPFLNSIKK